MNRIPFLVLLLAIGLSSCATTPRTGQVAIAPKPTEKVRQDYLKPGDVQRVRTGEFVKTYHLGRSVRGRGGSTLHEAHRVYRLEKPGRWNLFRDQPPLASVGPVNKIVDSAFKPAPESKAIEAELNRQREMSSRLEKAHVELIDAVAQVRSRLGEKAENTETARDLRSELARLRSENERLERAQANSIPLPEPPSANPGEALKKWGDKLDSEKP